MVPFEAPVEGPWQDLASKEWEPFPDWDSCGGSGHRLGVPEIWKLLLAEKIQGEHLH